MQIYLVGGAVRDKLLGLEVKDRDWVVVGTTPEVMISKGYKQVGADFPVFLHPQTGEEYALARTERKQGRGYHGFTVYSAPDVTLEDDLKRRDLTINAMAEAENGELIDPFNGLADLEQKRLRHVSTAFEEDPLRILRTARFAARLQPMGFSICSETLSLMRTMVAGGELDALAPERVWQEIQRALHEQAPGVFFDVLKQVGALAALMPELAAEPAMQQGLQALQCMHRTQGSTAQRYAALLSGIDGALALKRANTMKSPNDCRELVRLCCRFMAELRDMESARNLAPELLASLMDEADLWRRPERFDSLLATLNCTLGNHGPALINHLESAARQARSVTPQTFLQQGIQGKALGEAIRNERLARIKATLHSSV